MLTILGPCTLIIYEHYLRQQVKSARLMPRLYKICKISFNLLYYNYYVK